MAKTDSYRAKTRTVEIEWIPMQDGRRLAARLFLPKDVERKPVPVILEYIPYRRRDGTRLGDDQMHLWFAANGYACARVDISGTGDSDGLVGDEYVKREQDDVLEIIEYLGTRPWCSGTVGMIGISWGGFSGLQAAARRPPRLKAIVTMCSTDDRYACDAHYFGGCLLNDNFNWGGAFFNYAALPPDPAIVGADKWRDMWRERIDAHHLVPAGWMRHQRRDAFWKHGSVCEDYSAIECAVLAVGGYLDGYTRTVFRLVENLKSPCKGLIGPWGHKEPEFGFPGPAIGFLEECKRWWDRWLKGIENGAEQDPQMRLWLMDPATPDPVAETRPGRWIEFPKWPAASIKARDFGLTAEGALTTTKQRARKTAERAIRSPLTTGATHQEWCPFGLGRLAPDGASDQREDDGNSLCFDLPPLTQDLRIMGFGRAKLRIKADNPQALVSVRVSDVAPDGTSTLVTFGVLNLTHRDGHEKPKPLKPGQFYDVAVELKPVGQIVPKGHRLRLAIASANWPMVWPSPDAPTLTIDTARSTLSLPLLPASARGRPARFPKPTFAPETAVTVLEPGRQIRTRTVNIETQVMDLSVISDDGRYRIEEIGTEIGATYTRRMSIRRDDPTSPRTEVEYRSLFKRADWHARLDTAIVVTSDRRYFYVKGKLTAYDGEKVFAERAFDEKISRDNM
ncbi:MAG TPA: CocE/NonD family hydrolase [Dongiaceae bacterium]|nr:CocE/NonD family hydrolase [Dongiaceae bacterium]